MGEPNSERSSFTRSTVLSSGTCGLGAGVGPAAHNKRAGRGSSLGGRYRARASKGDEQG